MYGIRTNGKIGEREKEERRDMIAKKQAKIAALKQSGYSFKEIADILCLPESSIEELMR